MSNLRKARPVPECIPTYHLGMLRLTPVCLLASGAPQVSLMAGTSGPPRRPEGPPQVGSAKPSAPRTVDPLSGRAPWDYEPVAKSLENVEEAELAPLSRFIESMGAGWAIVPGVLWLLAALVPIVIM